MRLVTVLLIALAATFGPVFTAPPPAQAADCGFVLGFSTLHDLIPGTVGNCLVNVHYAANGDALQETTNGLLVWRKADNFTAFTNGYRTWVNGPSGCQMRLNTQRFPWESDYNGNQPPMSGGGYNGGQPPMSGSGHNGTHPMMR